eukprot:TRINITY_DN4887_c0_g1_i6.p1 TRINITY_DN4887_c0_g1~~TRINITY_DN4887_c0_g1_i6.p1  ORF type:complete len:232 (+),score=83.99 TRINITY_DN4887_c0_g1_i6:474-1169(+)
MDHEGDPFCLTCKRNRLDRGSATTPSEICAKCKKPITGKFLTINGQHVHAEHYRCEECGSDFTGGNFQEFEGHFFCSTCYAKRLTTSCTRCGKPIPGRRINALNSVWHPECFCCVVCNEVLSSLEFKSHDGQPYCTLHWKQRHGKLCHKCQKDASAGSFEIFGKIYHPQCFECHGCSVNLYQKKLYDFEGTPMCPKCFKKLPKEVQTKIVEKQKAMEKLAKEKEKAAKAKK